LTVSILNEVKRRLQIKKTVMVNMSMNTGIW